MAYSLLSRSMIERLVALLEHSDAKRRALGLTLAGIGVLLIYAAR
ncbi:hypothetical protein [Temperatibacter marinus]